MARLLYWIGPVAAAVGVVAASAVPAQAASAPGYSVTIGAKGSTPGYIHGRTYGYALVLYQQRGYDIGSIKGAVAGARAGDVVSLLAEPFGKHSFTPTGQAATLATSGSGSYGFKVQPALATRYKIQISTDSAVDVTSASATVYVMPGGTGSRTTKVCHRGTCRYFYTVTSVLPASAYRTESAKHLYLYLAQWKSGKHRARWYYRSAASGASKPARVNGHEHRETLTWRFSLSHGTHFAIAACSKDTERKDGIGLPGHHFCGARRLSVRQATGYLG